VIEKLRGLRLTTAAELVESAVEETLAYYAFPEEHWRRIRTTDEIDKYFFCEPATLWKSRQLPSFVRLLFGRTTEPFDCAADARRGDQDWGVFAPRAGSYGQRRLLLSERGRPRGEAWRVGCKRHQTA
jgi:hypothetical protein